MFQTYTRPAAEIADILDKMAADLLRGTITWDETPQGQSYWQDVKHNLNKLAKSARDSIIPTLTIGGDIGKVDVVIVNGVRFRKSRL